MASDPEGATVDDHDLDGFDPYDAFDAEAARVRGFLEALDDEAWAEPTRCDLWDRRSLAAHLDATEDYHQACLDDALGDLMAQYLAAGVTGLDDANRVGVEARADESASAVVAHWADRNADTRRRFRQRDGGLLATMAGPYPVRWQAFHIADELATHADDLGVPVPRDELAARQAWRAAFARFALHETHPEVAPRAVAGGTEVTVGGRHVVVDDASVIDVVMGREPTGGPVDDDVRAALALMA